MTGLSVDDATASGTWPVWRPTVWLCVPITAATTSGAATVAAIRSAGSPSSRSRDTPASVASDWTVWSPSCTTCTASTSAAKNGATALAMASTGLAAGELSIAAMTRLM